jgi:glycosyltransferase involved in cell wall biosynthesis
LENKEAVTIVIPAYNAENFITDAVKSCFTQIYRPLQVVVVNDCSTDNTPSIVTELSQTLQSRDFELRLVNLEANKGAANALNEGFSHSKGAFLCWLSADDMFIDKKKISKQVTCMKKNDAVWSYCNYAYTGPDCASAKLNKPCYIPFLSFLDPLFIRDSELRLMLLLFRNPINGSSIMINKNTVKKYGQFDPATRNVDLDGDLWMRYTALNLRLAMVKGAFVFYRVHSMQTSKKEVQMLYGCDLTRVRMLQTLHESGKLPRLIKKFTPFLPFIVETHYHRARPFVSKYLFKYMIDNKKQFDPLLIKYVQRSLDSVEKHIERTQLNVKGFEKNLNTFNQTPTFQRFKKLYV